MLPIIQAYAEGKTIQFLDGGKWLDLYESDFYKSPERYRIKAEPKYRPFKTKEECWNEMMKHQPFGWVKDKDGQYIHIVSVREEKSFNYWFNNFTFTDGAPFGVMGE